MSGHSKWKTIKHQKGVADARRGQAFTRLAREITMAAKEGGGSPESNIRLRLAIEKARAGSMPKDNIERAIKRGTGEDKEGAAFETVMYEGYGPHGVALLMQVVTDNKNRSVADLRRHVTRAGGTMAEAGAVGWQFTRKAYVTVPAEGNDADSIFLLAADAGAEDVLPGEQEIEIFAPADKFNSVVKTLDRAGVKIDESQLRMEPNQRMELPPDQAVSVMKLIEQLEELDDVESVYTNLEFTDAALKAMQEQA
jgi:YebC/PmpR family DNA-binding regulatory protein